MKEIEDNQLHKLFGVLKDGEAKVSASSWRSLSGKIPKPGFWQIGWSHFNILYTIAGVLIISAIVWKITTTNVYKDSAANGADIRLEKTDKSAAPAIEDKFSSDPSNSSFNNIYADTVDISANKKDLKWFTSEDSNKSNNAERILNLDDNKSVTGSDTKQPEAAEKSDVADKTTLDSSKVNPVVQPEGSNPVNSNSTKQKEAPKAKKTIVFEEESVIKVDTVVTKKKIRK